METSDHRSLLKHQEAMRWHTQPLKWMTARIQSRFSWRRQRKPARFFMSGIRLWEKFATWKSEESSKLLTNNYQNLQCTTYFVHCKRSTKRSPLQRIAMKSLQKFIEGQLMPCKQIQSDYRWAMVIQAYLKGIVLENEAQATNQMLSYPVSSRSCTSRYRSGWNWKKLEISLWDTSR